MPTSRAFETFLRQVRPVLVQHHGDALAEKIETATRIEYERLRPDVPDIGGLANFFQADLSALTGPSSELVTQLRGSWVIPFPGTGPLGPICRNK